MSHYTLGAHQAHVSQQYISNLLVVNHIIMVEVGLGGPPDPRPLPFFDLRPRLGQLVEVRPKLLAQL